MHFFTLSLAVGLHLSLLPYCTPAALCEPRFPPPLSAQKLGLVRANAISISNQSWEIGTLAEALTELEWKRFGVFAHHSFPPPACLEPGEAADVMSIAETVVARKQPGMLPLIDGAGAVGDPASIGVSVLLRNWTLPDSENTTFATAASEQLDYLLNVAPRAPNGAISQRENQVQLWADFVYMAPPFIAYYGALEDESTGRDLLQTAYDQVRFYREVLYDQNVSLWRHIALGNGTDPTHWATGNAWAAAGSMRVLATIKRSRVASKMTQQQCDLEQWVGEILDGAWSFQQPNGTLLNYIDQPNSFADSASTALMAAATFRFASITCNNTHIPAAIRALRLVQHSIDDQGWLFNMVDPLTFSSESPPGQHSPEGQSFVLLLEAAVAEWKWLQENGN